MEERAELVGDGAGSEIGPTLCPHLGGPLEDVPLEGRRITCRWHAYGNDLRNGRCVTGQRLTLEPRVRVVVDPEHGEASLVW